MTHLKQTHVRNLNTALNVHILPARIACSTARRHSTEGTGCRCLYACCSSLWRMLYLARSSDERFHNLDRALRIANVVRTE